MVNLFRYEVMVPVEKERDFVDYMREQDDEVWIPAQESWGYCKENPGFREYYAQNDGYVVYQNFCARYGTSARLMQQCYEKHGCPKYAVMCCTATPGTPMFQLMQFRYGGLKIMESVMKRAG